MCSPSLVIAGASASLQLYNIIQQQENANETAKINNRNATLAKLNADRGEKLRIRQVRVRDQSKLYENAIAARKARATVTTAAETMGGGVLDRLIADYYRQEGNYSSRILDNLEAETAQSRQNFEAIALNQQARQTYVPKVDYVTSFASAATTFGQDYLDYQSTQEQLELDKEIAEQNRQILSRNIG